MKKLYQNKDWLEHQYIIEKNSMAKIAKICKVSDQTILNWLIKNNIERRTISEANKGRYFSEEHRNNLSNAGKGRRHSEETKQKIGKASKGRYFSREMKNKMSKSKIGKKNHFYGKHHSEESKQKNREKHLGKEGYWKDKKRPEFSGENHPMKGKHHSEESKQKNREKHLGKHHSDESKKKISNSHKGKILSKEIRQKISETRKERIKNGEIEKLYGDKNPNWNPNREEVKNLYGYNFYDIKLRSERWDLQHGRDLLTGEKLEWGFYSKYHHIDWNKSNDNADNHIWVNTSTHGKVHSKRKRKYYEVILQKNLQTLKEGKVPETWKSKNKEMFRQENMIQLQLTDKLLYI
jgi:hypothetical protein